MLPDALETECKKCSEKQKKGADKVLDFLIQNKPATYKELEAKYDSKGVYRKRYENEAAKRGFKLPA